MNKTNFLGAFFIAHPFILRISNVPGARIGKDTFLLLFVALFFVLFNNGVAGSSKRSFEKWFFAAILLIGYLGQFNFMHPEVFYQGIFLCVGIMFYWLIETNFFYVELKKLERYILFGASLQVAFMLLESAGYNPFHLYVNALGDVQIQTIKSKVGGPLQHGNLTGAYMAMCLPFALKKENLVFLPALILGLFFSNSALSWSCAIAGVIYFLTISKIKNKYIYFGGALFLMICAFQFGIGGFDSERINLWKFTISVFNKGEVFGNGLGYFAAFFPKFGKFVTGEIVRNEHSEFLSAYIAFGGVGLVAFIYFIFDSISDHAIYTSALLVCFINFFGNFTLHSSPLFCLVSLIFILNRKFQRLKP